MSHRLPAPVRFLRDAIGGFVAHDASTLAASIAYYTALSLAPLLVLVLWFAASVSHDAREQLAGEIGALLGGQAMQAVKTIIDSAANEPSLGSAAGWIGAALLLLAGSAVFSQLQTALNVIWGTRPLARDDVRYMFWAWVRRRLLAIGILAAFVFLLIVSLAMSAFVNAALLYRGPFWGVVNLLASLCVFTLLFAALFRYLPDERLCWRDTWSGAFVTALLFAIGKYAIEIYLVHSGIASAYGQAGSFALLLVWVYYSAAIFLFGAECIRVLAAARGGMTVQSPGAEHDVTHRIVPDARG